MFSGSAVPWPKGPECTFLTVQTDQKFELESRTKT